jgi:hypothetical protein
MDLMTWQRDRIHQKIGFFGENGEFGGMLSFDQVTRSMSNNLKNNSQ